jgi:hypothetical protein
VTVNVDNAVALLGFCLDEANASQASQPAGSDGNTVATSLVRAIDRSRSRAADIQ